MTRRLTFTILALVLGTAVACGGAKPAETDQSTSTPPATTESGGAAAAAQGLQQMAQTLGSGQPPALVDGEDLRALLPDLDGWEKQDPKFEQVSMGVASFSVGRAEYQRGDASIEFSITDSAMSQLVLAPFMMFVGSGYAQRSDDGYTKAVTIAGQPGFEKWEQDAQRAEVVAIVANRFIVQAEGHQVDGVEAVRAAVEAVDFSKLSSLK